MTAPTLCAEEGCNNPRPSTSRNLVCDPCRRKAREEHARLEEQARAVEAHGSLYAVAQDYERARQLRRKLAAYQRERIGPDIDRSKLATAVARIIERCEAKIEPAKREGQAKVNKRCPCSENGSTPIPVTDDGRCMCVKCAFPIDSRSPWHYLRKEAGRRPSFIRFRASNGPGSAEGPSRAAVKVLR